MTEKLLNDNVTGQVRKVFDQQLAQPVEVLFFGKQADCDYCDDTQQLVQEVVDLSEKLGMSAYDLEQDAEIARQYNVDKTPGLVIAGRDGDKIIDYGIRYAGIPSGYEFGSLIQSLVLVSGRESGLNPKTRQALKELKKPVNMLVFTTPT
jgi:alkyl hydroperoxide reductase subunit AhpF